MTDIQVSLPAKINGIFLTHDMLLTVNQFQTGSSDNFKDGPVYNNLGIKNMEYDINELNHYIINLIAMADVDENCATEIKLLTHLHWIRETIISLKIPDEYLTEKQS